MTVEAAVLQGKIIAMLVLIFIMVTAVLALQIVTTTNISNAVLILDVLVSFQVC